MSGASITAIIPLWNRRELIEPLFASLRAQTAAPREIVAVDNGSEDGAAEAAASAGARVLRMGRNAGFATAVNRGIRESGGEWLAVINNDATLAPDYLERLARAASSSGAWFATGKILAADGSGRIDATWDAVCRGACAWRVGAGRMDGPAFAQARRIWCAPWTAALFRAELFARAGVLDESFESYLEDVDFGLRCAALGLEGVYVPDAVAWHRGSATLGRWHSDTIRRVSRNQVLLAMRRYPGALTWPVVMAQLLWGLVALRHGRGMAWLRGKLEGMRAVSGQPRAARSEQLAKAVAESEREIYAFQQAGGFDLYWRLYFLLTRREAK